MRKKKRGQNKPQLFFFHMGPMNQTLHLIGFIIMIYGAWFHNIFWLLSGIIPMLIGYWWEVVHTK